MGFIETYATPYRLYRYRRIVDEKPREDRLGRELTAIRERYVYCPNAGDMNDPMEGTHRVSAALKLIVDRKRPDLLQEVETTKGVLGIASFSEVYDHEPMWAHYANEFAGMCVSYRFGRLVNEIGDENAMVRMTYSESEPVLRVGRTSVDEMARATLCTKTVRWMSEREWRLISPAKGKIFYRTTDCVTRVFLGSRIDPIHEDRIRREMGLLNIPVFKMKLDNYLIDFVRLSRVGGSPTTRRSARRSTPASASRK